MQDTDQSKPMLQGPEGRKTGGAFEHLCRQALSRGEVLDAEALDRFHTLVTERPEVTDEDRAWARETASLLQGPEGCKLVPVEPTEAMLKAAENLDTFEPFSTNRSYVADDEAKWEAMLHAAPHLPLEEDGLSRSQPCGEVSADAEIVAGLGAEPSAAEWKARALEAEAKLNTPELHDFAAGVALEAAHQRGRWGSDHDAGKEPQDWFWLLGWLAGKAAKACQEGDVDKAKHHTISSAAYLANWHAQLSGSSNAMRPGIDPVARGLTEEHA